MGAAQPASALFFLAILGMRGAVIVPFLGIRSITDEPDTDPHRSEKPMLARVVLQALTAALVVAALAPQ